jgi:hypothetical protein
MFWLLLALTAYTLWAAWHLLWALRRRWARRRVRKALERLGQGMYDLYAERQRQIRVGLAKEDE